MVEKTTPVAEKTALSRLEQVIYGGSRAINWIGVFTLVAMMLMLTFDVAGRRLFNHPLPNVLELAEFFLVIVVMFALADCAANKGHVNIGVLVNRFPKKGQVIMDMLAYLLGFVIFALLAWRNIVSGLEIWSVGETRGILRVPVYPFIFIFAFGCISMCLVLLSQFLTAAIREVRR